MQKLALAVAGPGVGMAGQTAIRAEMGYSPFVGDPDESRCGVASRVGLTGAREGSIWLGKSLSNGRIGAQLPKAAVHE